jgi:hypothetical protein
MRRRNRPLAALLVTIVLAGGSLAARTGSVATPKEQLGFEIGADYQLASYKQLEAYWKKLDQESERMTLVDIGQTSEGRSQWMAVITSPENHKKLARYKEIAQKLAHAESLTDDQAHALAAEGKAVVWIDGGLHATEVLGAQQLMQLVYDLVSKNDAETQRFLRDVILLAVPANPDGLDLCAEWYMRESDPLKRSLDWLPRPYQKYAGHDNNRDFFMSNLAETRNMNRVLYQEWFPQIVYNHHQSGAAGTVLFAPPYSDPINYNVDPLVAVGTDLVGAAMRSRFAAEGKPGVMRGSIFSPWWNGGLSTTPYFHNMIGVLTEMNGSPTPMDIPFIPERLIASGDLPQPMTPQKTWHFEQSIDYAITADRAVLDIASRYREELLFNIYRMGKSSIERGSRDSWTTTPDRVTAIKAAVTKERATPGYNREKEDPTRFLITWRDPTSRDPRGYVLPSDQPDFLTATKFVNTLMRNGIAVHRASVAFRAGGKSYPAGSFVVKAAQAFRPHLLDMFEPQDYPDDFVYPSGLPRSPADIAGWTLAYQMGVEFDRILDGFDGPFERLTELATPPAGKVTELSGAAGFVFSHAQNDAFVVINRLLKNGEDVYWLTKPLGGTDVATATAPGTIYVASSGRVPPMLKKAATELGVSFAAVRQAPDVSAIRLRPVRIGLFDYYGGSSGSGWLRWLLEQYEFPYDVVYAPTLDSANLEASYDVLIFTDYIPDRDPSEEDARRMATYYEGAPARYRSQMGSMTVAKTVPKLKAFLERGGAILGIGGATHSLPSLLKLPITNALVEQTEKGATRLTSAKLYIPGSILRMRVDNTTPLAYGLPAQLDVFYSNSPVFRLGPDAALNGVRPVAWFSQDEPLLRSGWGIGQNYVQGSVGIIEAIVGKGRVFLFGPEITFRAQPHGTFKFLFNGIYWGPAAARRVTAPATSETR